MTDQSQDGLAKRMLTAHRKSAVALYAALPKTARRLLADEFKSLPITKPGWSDWLISKQAMPLSAAA